MSSFITLEVRFFLVSVLWGVILLVLYDCLRIFRKVIRHGAVLISIEDIIYWTVSSVLIFRMMYQMNDGVIRGFSLLGILLGMIVYKYSISDLVVKLISFVLNKIKKFLIKVIQFLLKPLRLFAGFIKKKISILGNFVKMKLVHMTHFVQNRATMLWKALKTKAKRGKMNKSERNEPGDDQEHIKDKKKHSKRKNAIGRKSADRKENRKDSRKNKRKENSHKLIQE